MTTLELTAIRKQPEDPDLLVALDRIYELEGETPDDETWRNMVELARTASADGVVQLKASREDGEVRGSAGPILVHVQWLGQGIHLYHGTLEGADEQFLALLDRLRDRGFSIIQGYEAKEVPPETTVEEMAAVQRSLGG